MALPVPTLSFTIPSLQDDTVLDCRVYHPATFSSAGELDGGSWRKKGAIIAHPYAPLGGSFDDPVVASIGRELRKNGYVVGTFNFRGAGESRGSTSWTAKGEVADYVSYAAFFIHYLHHLRPPPTSSLRARPQPFCTAKDGTLTTIPSSTLPEGLLRGDNGEKISLILGGYSYGSLITTYLPPVDAMLARFDTVEEGSSEAEIVVRAERLASQWNKEAHADVEPSRGRPPRGHNASRSISSPIIVGGDEAEPGVRRPSREARHSMDSIRRSLDVVRNGSNHKRHSSRAQSHRGISPEARLSTKTDHPFVPDVSYLLVSPLLPPISGLITFFSDPSRFWSPPGRNGSTKASKKLVENPTCAIWGSKDSFTSHKKLRKWAEGLATRPLSHFRFWEIIDAGHFFHEEGVEAQLRGYVSQWSRDILHESA